MDTIECLVVGAGVLGLAVARALSQRGREVVVLEQGEAIGMETSSRNSEVIHAGIYYPKDSLKARLCVAGREMLYHYCRERHIAHRRCGKLIVATDSSQQTILAELRKRAEGNGVDDLRALSRDEALALEPELRCSSALLSPSTGILDAHALMLSYLGDAENAGATLALQTCFSGGSITEAGIEVRIDGEQTPALRTSCLVNCAGLHADRVALALNGFPQEMIAIQRYAKGTYFTLATKPPFSHLIYPVPEPGGLGVHLTLDLAGRARFGPDVEWVNEIDYDVDPGRGASFYGSVRRYWPGLPEGSLRPDYAGIRPKLEHPGDGVADFRIQGPSDHGVAGLVNLFGMESPGLTASLAVADAVCAQLSLP